MTQPAYRGLLYKKLFLVLPLVNKLFKHVAVGLGPSLSRWGNQQTIENLTKNDWPMKMTIDSANSSCVVIMTTNQWQIGIFQIPNMKENSQITQFCNLNLFSKQKQQCPGLKKTPYTWGQRQSGSTI